jgi:hypothetical protein
MFGGCTVKNVDLGRFNTGSRVRIPLEAWVFVHVFLCCLEHAKALRQFEPPSKEPYINLNVENKVRKSGREIIQEGYC